LSLNSCWRREKRCSVGGWLQRKPVNGLSHN